ncbi:MAG: hypothetical protein HZA50_12885 [Planctomycetes bacterium]|nr:hypothetical protein [Planctomycetota bacterium]
MKIKMKKDDTSKILQEEWESFQKTLNEKIVEIISPCLCAGCLANVRRKLGVVNEMRDQVHDQIASRLKADK